MLKGKLGSGPNLTFRFNATDEELEVELIPDVQQPLSPKLKSIPERDDGSGNEDSTHVMENEKTSRPPSPSLNLSMSCPVAPESSPVKEYLNKLSRRSSSLDASEATDAAWNLLADIKGKISRTVEDKITEIKQENRLLHKKLSKRARSLQLIGINKDDDKDKVEETPEEDDEKRDEILNMKAVQDGFRGFFTRNKPESFESVAEQAPKPIKSQRSASLVDLESFHSAKLLSNNPATALKSPIEPTTQDLKKRQKKFHSPIRLTPKVGLIPHERVLPTPEVEAAEEADELLTESLPIQTVLAQVQQNARKTVPAQNQEASQPKHQFWLGILILLGVLLCWIAPFAAGFVLGVSSALFAVHKALENPKVSLFKPKINFQTIRVKEHTALPCVEGWMNELTGPYRPEKRGKTRPVYVRIQGPVLLVLVPRHDKEPNKYASWDEPVRTPLPSSLLQRRRLVLEGAQVTLEPELSEKRLWFRKYPIKISLDPKNVVSSTEMSPESDRLYFDAVDNPPGSNASHSEDDFEQVSLEMCAEKEVYLFARSDREKEDWFRAFSVASKLQASSTPSSSPNSTPKRSGWIDIFAEDATMVFSSENGKDINLGEALKQQMAAFMIPMKELEAEPDFSSGLNELDNSQVLWFNAFVARVMFDFLRQAEWAEVVKMRLQKKLSKIKMPHFMQGLCITHLSLGKNVPKINKVGAPFVNSRGLWIFLDIKYDGGVKMSIQTKLCVGKGLIGPDLAESENAEKKLGTKNGDDSDDESIPSSSESEDEGESDAPTDDSTLKSVVSKITSSKYFQQAAESKYVRKALENVSNIRLLLEVELQALEGTLVLCIPPPPTNRLWYGFKTPPRLEITARPKLGEHEVNYSHVTSWIEKKLEREFQDLLVLPNMDDLIIPVMGTSLP